MPVLRLSHTGDQVEAAYEGDGPRQIEPRPFSFALSAQDAKDIRWYLEDYPVYPIEPQPRIAKRIERRMEEVGRELFRQVLAGSGVWESARRNLGETRIEVETELDDALVPWELMRDPVADLPLALAVPSFVRLHSRPAMKPHPAAARGQGAGRALPRDSLRWPRPERRSVFRKPRACGERAIGEGGGPGQAPARNARAAADSECLLLDRQRTAPQPEQGADLHQQIRQFGSFAHAVMDYGAAGVVAWRYSVFVDTAAQYVAVLYAALASGQALGEAGTLARKQLQSAKPDIEDWTVPVVFEAAPVRLFPKREETFTIKLEARAATDSGLTQAPDADFIGRDETILRLDRTFDGQPIILLHAYAGSGKTSTAAEFARWYRQTGGLAGPCCSRRSSSTRLCRRCWTHWGGSSRTRWRRAGFNG
jgi:hypothetical protein